MCGSVELLDYVLLQSLKTPTLRESYQKRLIYILLLTQRI